MQQTLHLIRHGEINSNITGALDTATPGPPLNTTGLDQAKRLVNTFANAPLDTIYASTVTRAQMTAEPLAQARGLEINVRDGLKEISAGSLEMSADRAHQKEYLGVITSWMLGELDTKLAGGTTGHEVLERFDSVVTEIKESGAQHTAIVAHGAIIVFWSAMRAPNLTGDILQNYPPLNTGVVSLRPTSPDRLLSATGQSATGARPDWIAKSWMGISL